MWIEPRGASRIFFLSLAISESKEIRRSCVGRVTGSNSVAPASKNGLLRPSRRRRKSACALHTGACDGGVFKDTAEGISHVPIALAGLAANPDWRLPPAACLGPAGRRRRLRRLPGPGHPAVDKGPGAGRATARGRLRR